MNENERLLTALLKFTADQLHEFLHSAEVSKILQDQLESSSDLEEAS